MDQLGIVQIETSTACQAKCDFCPTGNGQRTRHGARMSMDLFRSVVDQAWEMGVRIIVPYGNNEPFLDTRIWDILDYLRDKGMAVYLNTNMALVTPEKADKLVTYYNLKEVTMSLHGATPETYQRVMGLDYATTLANARYLTQIAPFPLRHYMLQYEPNMQDANAFIQEWGDKASISNAVFNWGGSVNSEYARQFQKPPHPCERLLSQVFVLADGRCTCCMDANGVQIVGDLTKQTLREMWEAAQVYRDLHHQERYDEMPLCKTCNMNRW